MEKSTKSVIPPETPGETNNRVKTENPPSKLYYGDCLTIMRNMKLSSIDLIYLDPPFNSNQAYNTIYKDETGCPLPDQIEAFCDQWSLDTDRERAIRNMPVLMREANIDDRVVEFWRIWMNALRNTQPRLLAYLSYMVERLIWMKGLLRPSGSVYLHCDPTASHYLKVMMDGVFGHENFQNEIVWKRYAVHSLATKCFDTVSDTILVYAKDKRWLKFNKVYGNVDENKFPHTEVETGRRFQHVALEQSSNYSSAGETRVIGKQKVTSRLGWRWSQETFDERLAQNPYLIYWTKKGRPRYKIYLDEYEGEPVGNIWTDIEYLSSGDNERLGYATQKPIALLRRIIQAASDEGDVVLDPFCGCATTLEAAHRLKRKWIGIDIAIHAIKRVAKKRLEERMHLLEGRDFTIEGVPRNLEGAKDLWDRDKYHFQKWCIEQVNGFVTSKRTADGGIDGRIYFEMRGKPDLQSMVLEVKGGRNVNIGDVRALRGVMEEDTAEMAGLIVMEPLGDRKARNFRQFMAEAGDLQDGEKLYSRMQMLSVSEILEGKRFDTPTTQGKEHPQAGFKL